MGCIAIVVLGGKGRARRESINNRGAAELVSLYVCFVPLASVDAGSGSRHKQQAVCVCVCGGGGAEYEAKSYQ